MRLRWAALVAYFAAALLPRIAAVFQGAVFADDLWHGPGGHLVSLRFLNVAELALWQTLFGDGYLLGAAPKIITALYTAALCGVLRALLLRWQIAPFCATLVPLLIPLHPLWNTFFSWNATGVYVLSLVFVALGYYWLTFDRVAFALAAIAIGVSGYQVHAGLLPALIVFEVALRRETPWLRRALFSGAGVALYGLAVMSMFLIGVKAWGARGIGVGRDSTWRGMIDNLAVITQPFLSYWFGEPAAWRWWRAPFVGLAAATAFIGRRLAMLPIVMPVLAAAVILPLNVSPTGPRVAGAIWVAAVLSLVPLLGRCSRGILIAIVLVFAAIAIPVCITDTDNRVRAWKADREVADAIGAYWERAGVTRREVTVFVEPSNIASSATLSRPIVMQNYARVTMWDYSNVIVCPEWFVTYYARMNFSNVARGSRWERGGASLFAQWEHDRAARVTRVRVLRRP
jgi:hypothetical protein